MPKTGVAKVDRVDKTKRTLGSKDSAARRAAARNAEIRGRAIDAEFAKQETQRQLDRLNKPASKKAEEFDFSKSADVELARRLAENAKQAVQPKSVKKR